MKRDSLRSAAQEARSPERQVTFSVRERTSEAHRGRGESTRSSRATSGSEVGLELDPGRQQAIEVYGFIGWAVTFITWIAYLLWAFLPEHVLQQLGILWYPNRYWALAGPTMLIVIVSSFATVYAAIGEVVHA
jgi:hypothetical protein